MSETVLLIYYNLIIALVLFVIGYVAYKWQIKKRNDKVLDQMEAFLKARGRMNYKDDGRLKRRQAEYDKKHPFKALKRQFKEKTKWLREN